MCEGCPNFSFYADCLRTSEDDYCQVEEFRDELANDWGEKYKELVLERGGIYADKNIES